MPAEPDAGASRSTPSGQKPPAQRPLDSVPWSVRLAATWSVVLVLIVTGLYVLGKVAIQLAPLVLALAATVFLAALLLPVYRLLRRLRLPSPLAALAAVGLLVALLAGPAALLWQQTLDQFADLPRQLDAGLDRLRTLLTSSGSPITAQQLDEISAVAVDRLRNALPGPVSGARLAAEVLGAALLVLVLTFFVLKDGAGMWQWLLRRAGPSRRSVLAEAGAAGWHTLTNWVHGTLLVAAIDAVGIGAALLVLRVPLAFPLAIVTFVGAFVPIVGATVAGLLAVLVALAANGPQTALLVAAAVIVVQQIEGNVLQPLMMKRQVRLHPAVILVAVAAGTLIGGIPGAFLAVPLVAVGYRVVVVAHHHRQPATDG